MPANPSWSPVQTRTYADELRSQQEDKARAEKRARDDREFAANQQQATPSWSPSSSGVYIGGGVARSGESESDDTGFPLSSILLFSTMFGVYKFYLLPNNSEALSQIIHKVDAFYNAVLTTPMGFILRHTFKAGENVWGYLATNTITASPNANFALAKVSMCLIVGGIGLTSWVLGKKLFNKFTTAFSITLCLCALILLAPAVLLFFYAIYVEVCRHL